MKVPLPTPEEFEALTNLYRVLDKAKLAESRAKADRITAESKIAALVKGPEEGQRTITLPDGSKIVVERGFNYSADLAGMREFCFDNKVFAPVKSKTTEALDMDGYKWYKKNDPQTFAAIAKFVAATPKKTAVKLTPPKK